MNAPDRAAWLAARKSGLGGSDIAAVLGLSPYRTPVDVYLDKIGEATPIEENEPMYWGTVLEDVVAREYAKRTGNRVQRINTMMRHPDHDWMLANLDRAIVTAGSRARVDPKSGRLAGADGLLECKTASAYKSQEWQGEDDDQVPTSYVAQCMWYLAIAGGDWCDIAVLIGGQRYVSKRITRDDETIRGMIAAADEFWNKHVLERIPPEPKTAGDVSALFPTDTGESIEATDSLRELIAQGVELRQQIDMLKLQLEGNEKQQILGVSGRIKAAMKEASAITVAGVPAVTWKRSNDAQSIDWENVAIDLNNQLVEVGIGHNLTEYAKANYITTKPGSRRFVWKD